MKKSTMFLATAAALGVAMFPTQINEAARGLRNNNPLNIKEGSDGGAQWEGEHELDEIGRAQRRQDKARHDEDQHVLRPLVQAHGLQQRLQPAAPVDEAFHLDIPAVILLLVAQHLLGNRGDEGDLLQRVVGDPTTAVSVHQDIAELSPKDVGRIDPPIHAGYDQHLVPRDGSEAGMSSGGRKVFVAVE